MPPCYCTQRISRRGPHKSARSTANRHSDRLHQPSRSLPYASRTAAECTASCGPLRVHCVVWAPKVEFPLCTTVCAILLCIYSSGWVFFTIPYFDWLFCVFRTAVISNDWMLIYSKIIKACFKQGQCEALILRIGFTSCAIRLLGLFSILFQIRISRLPYE